MQSISAALAWVRSSDRSFSVISISNTERNFRACEFRYLTFGRTSAFRCLVVSYTERSDRIRIISARKVTARERKAYEE